MNTSTFARPLCILGLVCGAALVAGCNRQDAAASAAAQASAPAPPRGIANEGAISQTADKTDSTSARGVANLPEPPSTNNPASSPSPIPAASQTTSATTLGTSPKPNDGTLASPGQGSTNVRGGVGAQ